MAVTTQSAANSVLGWTNENLKLFNKGQHPWNASRTERIGEAPHTVEEIETYLGDSLSQKSYDLVNKLKDLDEDSKLGFVTGINPCF